MSNTIHVRNLPCKMNETGVENVFNKYGRIRCVDVEQRTSHAVAVVEFEDYRDAQSAAGHCDGLDVKGNRLLVKVPSSETSRTQRFTPYWPRPQYDRRPNFENRRQDQPRLRPQWGPKRFQWSRPQRYRVYVERLPPSGSWQDVKDHFRRAHPLTADVDERGGAVLRFSEKKDAEYAVRKYHDTKFTSHRGHTTYIRVHGDRGDQKSFNVKKEVDCASEETPEDGHTSYIRVHGDREDQKSFNVKKEVDPAPEETSVRFRSQKSLKIQNPAEVRIKKEEMEHSDTESSAYRETPSRSSESSSDSDSDSEESSDSEEECPSDCDLCECD